MRSCRLFLVPGSGDIQRTNDEDENEEGTPARPPSTQAASPIKALLHSLMNGPSPDAQETRKLRISHCGSGRPAVTVLGGWGCNHNYGGAARWWANGKMFWTMFATLLSKAVLCLHSTKQDEIVVHRLSGGKV